jgi:hypothetical protein
MSDVVLTVGGPVPWFVAALMIEGENIDLDEITSLLEIAPDSVQRKGVTLLPRSGEPRCVPWIGTWSSHLRPEQAPECGVEDVVARILDRIDVPLVTWQSCLKGSRARIYLGLVLDDWNRGFGFDPSVLRRLSTFGIIVDIDIHSDEVAAEAAYAKCASFCRILNDGQEADEVSSEGPPPRWPISKPPAETSGGGVHWGSVSLHIYAEDLDPDKISRLLDLEPCFVQVKGVPMPSRGGRPGRIPSIGLWQATLHSEEVPGCSLEHAIWTVLDRIRVPDEIWRQVRAGTSQARISAKVDFDKSGQGFRLDSAIIERAADLDLCLDFDIYYSFGDDDV